MARQPRRQAEPAVVNAMAEMGEAVGKAMAALDSSIGRKRGGRAARRVEARPAPPGRVAASADRTARRPVQARKTAAARRKPAARKPRAR